MRGVSFTRSGRPSRADAQAVRRLVGRVLAGCLVAASIGTASAQDAPPAGPTPYPTDAKAWPGQGAIRVFGWMTEHRKGFWLQRDQARLPITPAGFQHFLDGLTPLLDPLQAR